MSREEASATGSEENSRRTFFNMMNRGIADLTEEDLKPIPLTQENLSRYIRLYQWKSSEVDFVADRIRQHVETLRMAIQSGDTETVERIIQELEQLARR